MPDNSDTTLQGLQEVVAASPAHPCLQWTVIFHPRVSLIGRCAAAAAPGGEHYLGRNAPLFAAAANAPGEPLDDPYVSRRALTLKPARGGVTLCRPPGACRSRLAGEDIQGEVFVADERLARGVPIMLAHSVVLLLRRAPWVLPPADQAVASELRGVSAVITALRAEIARTGRSRQDVLLRGETGTGKELVARAIHRASERGGGKLLAVNMAAVPASLAAATLFGNTRGAFSGADRARRGYFEQAEGGTLFLDEVGDSPEEVQPLLLRALQEREIQVVGGELKRVDVRVISATDARLDDRDCGFKSALRHRLGALEVYLPPLRERPEDIGLLLLHFLRQAWGEEKTTPFALDEALAPAQLARWADIFFRFSRYAWPGNVRQLQNFAAQVVVASETAAALPAGVAQALVGEADSPAPGVGEAPVRRQRRSREISEREFAEAMAACRYEVSPVARLLGISRQSVYRRIDSSRVFRRAQEVPQEELERALDGCADDLVAAALRLKVSESGLRDRVRILRASA